jgi:cell division septation protein DedD
VSELSHDTAEDGFHEIQLSGKQLVFLFIVTTSVIVAVFLCGVLVGRGARAARVDERDPVATSAPAPQPVADAGPPAAEPPAPAPETPDQLSYPDRLGGKRTAPESLKPQGRESQPPAQPQPQPQPRPAPPAPAATPPAAADVPMAGRPGTWVVQVIATRDRSVATSVVKRLGGKGYPAFLVNPAAGAAQPFYKVHVGRYKDRREAEEVSLRIKKEEQFPSWILR